MAPLWIILVVQVWLLPGVFGQLAEVILSPDCSGFVPAFPCQIVPVQDSKGNYIYDYQQEECDPVYWDCLAVNVVSDPTWFCYDVLNTAGGGFKARVELSTGIAAGKKEDNYAQCQTSRVLDLLSLGNCRDVTLYTCTDCATAYKRWICSMQFPKCIPYPFHMSTRKMNNFTAGMKTVWGYGGTDPNYVVNPCFELCYDVIRKCPPALQFSCPTDTRNYGNPPDCNNFNIPGF